MLLPLQWVNEYCNIEDIDHKDLANGLTDSGTHVEEIKNRYINNLVTGKIRSIEKHPDADKLSICQVDLGDDLVQIVCGAPNVALDQIVIVAREGAVLPGDFEIKKSTIRGVTSNGMICSLDELGYDQSVIPRKYRDGIFVLDEDTPIGQDGASILGLDYPVLYCEITPNRPDCLSIYGLARETSATFDLDLKEADFEIENPQGDIKDYFNGVQIETDKCKRFYARVLKDVVIEESPLWLQNRLMAAGIRPINNIVDLTNFAMLEYGQPTHAYDLDDLQGKAIRVYEAKDGQVFTTLDGQDRTLTSEDIIIADLEGPIGLGGVMGGLDSEIKDTTTTIVLEGANFDKTAIRRTSKRLGLRTEASTRFEKGVDPNSCKLAIDRICALAEEMGAAKVANGVNDIFPNDQEEISLRVRVDRTNDLLGIDLDQETMVHYLDRLGLSPSYLLGEISCTIPSYRQDLKIEEDLIEEIGRLYGYNNIQPKDPKTDTTRGELPENKKIKRVLGSSLKGMGFNELLTYSFISPSTFDKLDLPKDDPRRQTVRLLNPLGEEYSVMRTTLMGNTLDVLSRNQNRWVKEMLSFEVGNIFSKSIDQEGLPEESRVLSLGGYGKDIDFYYLKEALENALRDIGIRNVEVFRQKDNGLYHPGRCADIYIGDKYLGILGEVHPKIMDNFDLKERTILGEFDFDLIIKMANFETTYQELPKYPASTRDLAIIIDEDILVKEIEKIAKESSNGLVKEFEIFDIYTGDQIEEGKKSVAFNLGFRHKDKTLNDQEVNDTIANIIRHLEEKLGGKLRD